MRQQTRSQLAVCSWSGKPDSPKTLVTRLAQIPLNRVQLALDPLIESPAWSDTATVLSDAGVSVISGMIENGLEDYTTPSSIRVTGGLLPEAGFNRLLQRVPQYADLLDAYGLDKVSLHAGFIPVVAGAPYRILLLDRLRALAGAFAERGKLVLLETGQETAKTLSLFLDEAAAPNVRINFDPGNMLLYSMGDPVMALKTLLPRIAQIHIKDADPSGDVDVWGTEQPAGEGCVDWPAFFDLLVAANYAGDLVIERECGDQPVAEIKRAVAYLSQFLI